MSPFFQFQSVEFFLNLIENLYGCFLFSIAIEVSTTIRKTHGAPCINKSNQSIPVMVLPLTMFMICFQMWA